MTVSTSPPSSRSISELESFFRSLQLQTLAIVSLLLAVASVLLFSLSFANPGKGWLMTAAAVLLVTAGLVMLLRLRSFWGASVLLVVGCLVAVYTVAGRGLIPAAVFLWAVPAGLATLTLDIWGGSLAAAVVTLLLLLLPENLLPVSSELKWVCIFETWLTVGMLWLALRPLLNLVDWTRRAYEESQRLLGQARQAQSDLQQALEDAAAANQQLIRLNKLAQDLRQFAENERQAKQQFVANVSHELRTPLNMIIGFCEVILKKPQTYGKRPLPPVLLADLEVVLRNSQHLSELIDDVLDLSQIDAGKMALVKERVSLGEIIESAVIAIRPLYESKDLYLEYKVAADLPPVYCDRTRIREVILNLLSNAGRFTAQGGVRLNANHNDNTVTVMVADTGTGMTPEAKDRLFQPFQQADGSIYRRYGGTGLGLAISKSFIELHEGKMWVESQPGAGTTFFFQLPIDPPIPLKAGPLRWLNQWQTLKERPRVINPPSGEMKPRLLVVEQGDVLQKLLRRYLQDIEIDTAPDLDVALKDLAETPSQALLVNTLPIEPALARLTQTSALPYSTPAIICSVPGVDQASAALGASGYLVKPITQEALLQSLAQLSSSLHTILLVDDEPDAIQLFRRMLLASDRNYRVLRASNGRHALEILHEEKVDVILLDLTMPEMDGFQFLAVRNHDDSLSAIPVILISARDPSGQPIASNIIALTRGGGLSTVQMMDCIEAFTAILSPDAHPGGGQQPAESPPD